MDKFLTLCEQYDPRNSNDPKMTLYVFLKSKGVNVAMSTEDNKLHILTNDNQDIAIEVFIPEEDEQINAGTGTYEIDGEVEKLGNKASSGIGGAIGKIRGTAAQKAKSAVKKRQQVAVKAIDAYDQGTKRIEKGLQNIRRTSMSTTY